MTAGSFWHKKKVFLTGHTGFKGAWLAEILLGLGADVTGYALAPNTTPDLFGLLGLSGRLSSYIVADLRDGDSLKKAVAAARPDIVLHLGAQALVRDSYAMPVDTFETNINGTINLLEAVRQTDSIRAVVVVTTDKCYRNDDSGKAFVESDALGGKDPYSASKAAAEIVAQSYYESFLKSSVPLATARAGNVIGGGDWSRDRLIPDVIRAIGADKPIEIRNPAATRPWQHVLEPLRGYLLLAEMLYTNGHGYAGGWNFGPMPSGIQTVSYVLDKFNAILPFKSQLDQGQHVFESKALGLDVGKAMRDLGWVPQLGLDDGIALTAAWYRDFAAGMDMAAVTQAQIRDYFQSSAPAARSAVL